MRHLSPLDLFVDQADQLLRRLAGTGAYRQRPDALQDNDTLTEAERAESARLVRINHAGEVAAQALYQGQALGARSHELRLALTRAAREESDHLAWTAERIKELGGHTSYLNPAWYAGALALGMAAGLAGDRWSLGFIAETERQVVEHLEDQIRRLPAVDEKSRTILRQMSKDEAGHATSAMEAGGRTLPLPIRGAMRLASRIMVRTAYWI